MKNKMKPGTNTFKYTEMNSYQHGINITINPTRIYMYTSITNSFTENKTELSLSVGYISF